MSEEAIRVWCDGPRTMGAIYGLNLVEGETEFVPIPPPYGQGAQTAAAIEAARKLRKRLGLTDRYLPIIWSTPGAEQPNVIDFHGPNDDAQGDPAEWWKA